jgi:hypothetical protein
MGDIVARTDILYFLTVIFFPTPGSSQWRFTSTREGHLFIESRGYPNFQKYRRKVARPGILGDNMITDTEKQILLDWQRWNAFFDVMNSMGAEGGSSHDQTVAGYYNAVEQLKTIKDERIAAMVRDAYGPQPDVELTFEGHAELKRRKERTDKARRTLETASLEFGNNLPLKTA